MSWFKKKKVNPEDGDFPLVPKHYRENGGKVQLTSIIKPAPTLQWSGDATVVWGIDIGVRVTTVSFAYLLEGESGHNSQIWYCTHQFSTIRPKRRGSQHYVLAQGLSPSSVKCFWRIAARSQGEEVLQDTRNA
jgi:hypothetical protein